MTTAKKKGGDTRAKAAAAGKKVGRPPKAKIAQKATGSVATEVLAMDGPPNHQRRCTCEICTDHRERRCKCIKVKDQELPEECQAFAEHRICHCEVCGWWEALLAADKRLRKETRVYLTDRRDGKPAESIIAEGKLTIEIVEIPAADSSATETGPS
jgi:hypothetical protein